VFVRAIEGAVTMPSPDAPVIGVDELVDDPAAAVAAS